MKSIKKTFIFFIYMGGFLFTPLSFAKNKTTDCMDRSMVNEIKNNFLFYGNGKIDICDSTNPITKIFRAIEFIKNVKFSRSTKIKEVFGQNILNEQPYSYFKNRVKNIVLEVECRAANTAAYISLGEELKNKTMHICPHYFDLSILEQAMALVHEARHFEGYTHVKCIHGQFKAMPENLSCDSSYSEKGSYAIGVDFYLKIARDKSLNPALRNMAKISATEDLVTRFNHLPGDLKEGAFLTDEDGVITFFDGEKATQVSSLSKNQILFINDYTQPKLQDKFTSEVVNLTWGLKSMGVTGSVEKTGKELIDYTANKNYFCYLLKERLECQSFYTEEIIKIPFSQIYPRSIYFENILSEYIHLTMTDQSGHITELKIQIEKLKNLNESQIQSTAQDSDILKIQDWQDGRKKMIALTQTGKLLFFTRNNKEWTPLLPAKTFIQLISPMVWSPSLHSL